MKTKKEIKKEMRRIEMLHEVTYSEYRRKKIRIKTLQWVLNENSGGK